MDYGSVASELPLITSTRIHSLGDFEHEIADDRGVSIFKTGDGGWAWAIERTVTVAGAAAQEIADCWRQLPIGETARCHLPPIGVEFFAEKEWLLSASICWECNNIFTQTPEGRGGIHFYACHPLSQRLLALLGSKVELAQLDDHLQTLREDYERYGDYKPSAPGQL